MTNMDWYGDFHSGAPQNHWFVVEIPMKVDDLGGAPISGMVFPKSWMVYGKSMDDIWGYPYFGKPPCLVLQRKWAWHLYSGHYII